MFILLVKKYSSLASKERKHRDNVGIRQATGNNQSKDGIVAVNYQVSGCKDVALGTTCSIIAHVNGTCEFCIPVK